MTTILVVDDSAAERVLCGAIAKENGLNTIFAENGREALQKIESDRPDIVLTDLQMPEVDGLELVKTIRQGYSNVPVMLMTAYGSEEIAAEALQAGAASYVPKGQIRETFPGALATVLANVEAAKQRERVRQILVESESKFKLGYEPDGPLALISFLQEGLRGLNFCDDVGAFQICTALTEAITNAIDHGNLELSSTLRETGDYRKIGNERAMESPYRERRVFVTARLTENEAKFTVRDEGNGFNPEQLPDPTDPANLTKISGRGVLLIRTFMDDVQFNEKGNEITMVKRRNQTKSALN